MIRLLLSLILFSMISQSAHAAGEIIIEEEPTTAKIDITLPFMSCAGPSKESDYSNVTLMVSSTQPEQGMVIAIRNPDLNEFILEELQENFGDSNNYSDFNLSPVSMVSKDLKISQVNKKGLYKISGGAIGFTTIEEQTIDATQAKAKLKVKSLLGSEVIELNCSIYPGSLENAFN